MLYKCFHYIQNFPIDRIFNNIKLIKKETKLIIFLINLSIETLSQNLKKKKKNNITNLNLHKIIIIIEIPNIVHSYFIS